MTEDLEDARLTVVAIVRASLRGDEEAYSLLLDTTTDLRTLARVACAMAAALMRCLPEKLAEAALDAFTVAEGPMPAASWPKPPRRLRRKRR